ncbi:MAG: glycosyl hydrolase family 18 protein [Selenomonadaceae bacterium]
MLFGSFGEALGVIEMQSAAKTDLQLQKINLVWQPTFEKENNVAEIPKIDGVNVVSPCWFAIDTVQGHINSSVANREYVRKAHEKGYKVWALITNSFDDEMTSDLFKNKAVQRHIIQQMELLAYSYNLDGFNLDFENIKDEDKDCLTSFVQDIAVAMKNKNKSISIDVTVPGKVSNWSACYDRKALGKIVDYVILMAYDENSRLSKRSGSVASLPWVERGLVTTLKDVPAEKVILGVPLYMRRWEEIHGTVLARTLTMKEAEKIIADKKLQPVWLEKEKQYYFEYGEKEKKYRVWQENAKSLKYKSALVGKYKLAGIASWRKGFEQPDVWPVLKESIVPLGQFSKISIEKAKVEKKSFLLRKKNDKTESLIDRNI